MKKSSMTPTQPKAKEEEEEEDPLERSHAREKAFVEVRKIDRESDDINECAEAFIRRFRHQLQIQRLDSIENYKKMLARGL
ncbi:uncharacterized protein LOC143882916 [Tasmannia lanceolata]|uniref:uncharacterized protein LOC143882916 n=1 Tax=Tasmannia lanceolata TaxID=3420 RepID=UPI0040642DDE